jgi:hypothetical protein
MNKKHLFSVLIFFVSILGYSSELLEKNVLTTNLSSDQLSDYLLMDRKWVYYPDYNNRESWDKILGENKTTYINRGNSKLKYEWKVITATDYLDYERTGNRFTMQNKNSSNHDALADLVIAELAEGKGRFMDQIINGVFYFCEQTSWTLSAHLSRQASGRVIPDHNEHVIALVSAQTAAFLSWTYYFFNQEFDKVDPIISKRLKYEIYRKVIIPYRQNDHYWWLAINAPDGTMLNNWTPWCNSNVLQCVMLLEDDKEQLSKDVYRSMQSVDKYINYVSKDGACEEGPSYWEHAAGKLYDYLLLLQWITNDKISLFNTPFLRNMGEYISRTYVGNDWVVNFADASAKFTAKGSLVYRYGKSVNSDEMMKFGAFLERNSKSSVTFGVDFLRVLESIYYDNEIKKAKAEHITPDYTIYPETQFYYFKNNNNFFLAAKAGFNAESHNHNDAGTFSLWVDETPIFIDAGVGTYTRQTFGPERYTIWTMRSNYHNLPTINGNEQQFGKSYQATNVNVDTKKRVLSMNLANAYPASARIEDWTRIYKLTDKELLLTDKFKINNADKPNEIHFMLWGKIEVEDGKVFINVNDTNVELVFDENKLTAELETIHLPDVRLSKVWGKEIYRLTFKSKKIVQVDEYHFSIRKL